MSNIFDAEGELAVALETYCTDRGNSRDFDIDQCHQMIDSFAIEGKAGELSPIEWFLHDLLTQPKLPETASIPEHLQQLFEVALAQVNPSKSKAKNQAKSSRGF